MSWFQKLFGVEETEYAATKSRFKYDETTRVLTAPNEQNFAAGFFSTPTLEELRTEASKLKGELKGKLHVQEVVNDVSVLHVDPSNEGALFQAASQFNCLEFVSSKCRPEDGITCYAKDKTQGPACAISCAPGTVIRNYFALEGRGQTHDCQVENLSEMQAALREKGLGHAMWVKSGYTEGNEAGLMKMNELLDDTEFRNLLRSKIKIGLQNDVQVTSSKFGAVPYEGKAFCVSQAYCSACALGMYARPSNNALWEPFARLVLEAAYEATMCAGVINAVQRRGKAGANHVFLTALGGGVFGNNETWIADAMKRAFAEFKNVDLKVILVSFGDKWKPAQEFLSMYQKSPLIPRGRSLETIDLTDGSPTSKGSSVSKRPRTSVAFAGTIVIARNRDSKYKDVYLKCKDDSVKVLNGTELRVEEDVGEDLWVSHGGKRWGVKKHNTLRAVEACNRGEHTTVMLKPLTPAKDKLFVPNGTRIGLVPDAAEETCSVFFKHALWTVKKHNLRMEGSSPARKKFKSGASP